LSRFAITIVIALILFYWHSLNSYGFVREDSWLLRQDLFSFWDTLKWFLFARDPWGYFRPVRRVFFGILGFSKNPVLYFYCVYVVFGGSLLLFAATLRTFLVSWPVVWFFVFLFGTSAVHSSGLLWLSASHNVFALFFFLAALFSFLKGRKNLSLVFAIFAIGSRESAILILPVLFLFAFWIESRKENALYCFALVALSLYGIARHLGGELPPYLERVSAWNHLALVLDSWAKYLISFWWIDLSSIMSFRPSIFWRLLGFIFWMVLFLYFVFQFLRKKPESIFLALFIFGPVVHWVFPGKWEIGYFMFSLLGFYLALALNLRRIRLPVLRFLFLFFLWQGALVFLRAEDHKTQFASIFQRQEAWVHAFTSQVLNNDQDKVLVIGTTTHFEEHSTEAAGDIVYLPHDPRLLLQDQLLLWNSERTAFFGDTWGMGRRRFIFSEPQKFLKGTTLVHYREGAGIWEIKSRQKID